MPVVSSSIPNMVNGVSQQPDSLRLTSQCALLENAYCSVVKGVRKRAPFRHLAQLFNTNGYDNAYLHTINRDSVERYTVVITNGDLKVFAIDGTPRTVNFPNGKGYLANANPEQGFVALTVADYTFIANKGITCAMAATVSATRNHDAMIYVRQGAYGCGYSVYINGVQQAAYTTSSTVATDIDTAHVAGQLAASLTTNIGASYNVQVSGSVIYLQQKTAGVDFTLQTFDGLNNVGLVGVKDNIQRFSSLPSVAKDGFTVKVVGDSSGLYNGYYVKFVDSNSVSTSGTWTESTGQNVKLGFDNTTLPWQLVRNAGGDFTFQPVSWANRMVGDDTSAPQPSFIGRTISDIFFHRNRLGFLSGENVIFSKAGAFFNLWPDTVTQVLDSDRIDIAVNHVKVSTLRAAAPFKDALMLFSDQTQFVLQGGDLLSPRTVTVKPVTEFENSSFSAKPIYTGKVIYFGIPRGSFTGLRELQTLPINDTIDAPEVSSHVPQYIPSGVFKIAASSNVGILAILSSNERNAVYVYSYYWNGDQKLQSSWYKWVLDPGDVILNVDFIQTDLYAVIQRSDGVYLEVAHMELGNQDTGFSFQVNLDRQCYLTGVYNSGTNQTTWTLPYSTSGTGTYQVVLGSSFSSPSQAGTVLTTTQSGTTITATGNYSAGPCYIGRQYAFRYRFSHVLIREPNRSGGGGTEAVQEGRLQLNRLSVVYEQTGYFRAEVTPLARSLNTYQFTGYITGTSQAIIGQRPVLDGVFRFPVLTEARTVQIDLVNDTYLPNSFQSAEWEGKYYIRSNRV